MTIIMSRYKKAFLVPCVLLGLLLAVSTYSDSKLASKEGQVIVTVDLKMILTNSMASKAAQVRFRETVREAKALVDEKNESLGRLNEQLMNPGALSRDELQRKQRTFEKEKLRLKYLIDETQETLGRKEDRIMESLAKGIQEVIEDIALKNGYDFVLGNSMPTTVYAMATLDVSGQVLEAFDAKWLNENASSPSANPLPGAQPE
ncbi:OmpH family outer membrane protein [bacterium]|nr:OmpH family outer membrane protein [bacterium]